MEEALVVEGPVPVVVQALDEKRREDEAVDAPSGAEGKPGGEGSCYSGEDEGARIGQLVGRGDEAGPETMPVHEEQVQGQQGEHGGLDDKAFLYELQQGNADRDKGGEADAKEQVERGHGERHEPLDLLPGMRSGARDDGWQTGRKHADRYARQRADNLY